MTQKHIVNKYYGPSRLRFTHLLSTHPTLLQLRHRERLDDVVSGSATELDGILALKTWVGRQWQFGNPDPYPPWSAADILDWIRSGKTKGHCGQYAMVFLQGCLSLGVQARYVEIGHETNPYSHFTTEVYLSQLGKWAVMDATAARGFAAYYLRGGVPQSALELHRALMDGDREEVEVIRDSCVADGKEKAFGEGLENYYYLRVFFRQDQSINPPPFVDANDTAGRYTDSVEWEDDQTVPWEDTHVPAKYPVQRLAKRSTRNPEDLYWSPKVS